MNNEKKFKKRFDFEYATSYKAEVEYLKESGIRYAFVKDVEGISVYKYTKTAELFEALMEFYRKPNV